MANTVQIRFRSFLPGAGHDSGGSPKQGKQEVHGRITVTNYNRGGEGLTPADVGLTTIDHLDLQLVDPLTGPDPGQGARQVYYSGAAQEFYITVTTQAGVPTELAGTADPVLSFHAKGDSAHDVELL